MHQSGAEYPAFIIVTAAVILLSQIMNMLVSPESIMHESDRSICKKPCDKGYNQLGQKQLAYDRRTDGSGNEYRHHLI